MNGYHLSVLDSQFRSHDWSPESPKFGHFPEKRLKRHKILPGARTYFYFTVRFQTAITENRKDIHMKTMRKQPRYKNLKLKR